MTTIDCSTINNETLTHLVIINQMAATTGCSHEQAKQLLISTDWRLEAAVNLFFDERTVPIPCCKFSELVAPANTPATPPNFSETLLSLNKLSTSGGTPSPTTSILPNDNSTAVVTTTTTTTTSHSLSSSPMNMTIMMMDGSA